MHMDAYIDTLRRTLMETSSLGDEHTQEVARSLTAAFDPALRLVALQMLTDIADELNSELDDAHVAVVMDGSTPHLLVTQASPSSEPGSNHPQMPDHSAGTPVSEDDAASARVPQAAGRCRGPSSGALGQRLARGGGSALTGSRSVAVGRPSRWARNLRWCERRR